MARGWWHQHRAVQRNSTGLAASALGDTAQSEKAAQWLRNRQATDYDACDKLAGERGAIAYDNTVLNAGRSSGITTVCGQGPVASSHVTGPPAMAYLPVDATPSNPTSPDPAATESGSRSR